MTTDPTPDTLFTLYHGGAWLCLVIVAAYLALRYASLRVTWLDPVLHPDRAHYVTAAIAAIAVLIAPASQGTTPSTSMWLAAAGTLGALLLPGLVKRPSSPPEAGFANAHLLPFIALFGLAVGCAWLRSESKTVAGDVVDCTLTTATSNIKQYGPMVDALLVYATDGGGKINGDAVKAATTGFAKTVGGCVLADAIARALKPPAPDPNAPKSSPLLADPASLYATITELYPGVKFHTASGDL